MRFGSFAEILNRNWSLEPPFLQRCSRPASTDVTQDPPSAVRILTAAGLPGPGRSSGSTSRGLFPRQPRGPEKAPRLRSRLALQAPGMPRGLGLGHRELGACCSSWTAPSDRDTSLRAQSKWADPGRRRLRTRSREGLQSNPRKRPLQAVGPAGGEPGHGHGKRRDRRSRVPEVPLDALVLGAALEGPHSPSTSSSPAVCTESLALSVVSARHPCRESRTRQAPCLSPAPPGPPTPRTPSFP